MAADELAVNASGAPGAPGVPPDGPDPGRWRAWMAPVALVAALAGAILGGGLIAIAAVIFGASVDHPPAAVNLLGTLFQDACLILAAVSFARLARRPTPAQFGLRPTRLGPALAWLAAAWVSFIAFSGIWVALLSVNEKDNLPDQLGANDSTVALVGVIVLVCVVAPIAEEFFFRGFFFPALRGTFGLWFAAIVTGLVFGGIHAGSAPVGYLVPLAFFGFALCLLYERTGSLYPCMALHALNNSLAFGASKHWDWQIPLLMAGALGIIATIVLPVGLRGARRLRAA